MPGRVLVVTGTGTDVGKTVVTAAIAALAQEKRVAVVKPAQTGIACGESGDLAEVQRLTGEITCRELARYPEPLAPATAALRAGQPAVTVEAISSTVDDLAAEHDLVLLEGAGGLLVHYDEHGRTLADVARALRAPVLLVAHAGLGVLNTAALTMEALRARDLDCVGVVVGSWPAEPGLAARCNLADLPAVTGVPLLGAVPERSGELSADAFEKTARTSLAPELGGAWDAAEFIAWWNPVSPGADC